MTNKLLIPLTVAASLTIGAASYHFGAPFVEDYLASQEQTTKLQKSTDAQPNALVQATIAPVTSVPQPTVTYQHKENPPADIVQLVNRMEAMTDAYFSKEQQVDRIYNKAMDAMDSFTAAQLSTIEKEAAYRSAIPMSPEALARKKYTGFVAELDNFSQEALIGLSSEVTRRFSPATYNTEVREKCLNVCREKLDGGFGASYSTK